MKRWIRAVGTVSGVFWEGYPGFRLRPGYPDFWGTRNQTLFGMHACLGTAAASHRVAAGGGGGVPRAPWHLPVIRAYDARRDGGGDEREGGHVAAWVRVSGVSGLQSENSIAKYEELAIRNQGPGSVRIRNPSPAIRRLVVNIWDPLSGILESKFETEMQLTGVQVPLSVMNYHARDPARLRILQPAPR